MPDGTKLEAKAKETADPFDVLIPAPPGSFDAPKKSLKGQLFEESGQTLSEVRRAVRSKAKLPTKTREFLCQHLEAYGKDGNTVDIFAADLGLLPGEFLVLINRNPELKRSASLARTYRKKYIIEELQSSSQKNPAMKALMSEELSQDEFTKLVSKEEGEGGIAHIAERHLLENGIMPSRTHTILVLTGDEKVEDIEMKMGLMTPAEVMRKLK